MSLKGLEEKVKKEIIKSGFPLETFCVNKLRKLKWGVLSKQYFITPEDNLIEMDIISHIGSTYKKQEEEIPLHSLLTVECKKNKNNPWVFFKEELTPTINICSNIDNINNYLLNNFYKVKGHHFNNIKDWSRSYVMPFKSEESKESKQIYESIQKLIEHFKYYQEIKKKYEIKRKYIQICYLTVVFDGLMFMADVSEDNVRLKKVKHVIVSVCQFEFPRFNHYSIEVVSKQYFDNYITVLRNGHSIIENFFKMDDGYLKTSMK